VKFCKSTPVATSAPVGIPDVPVGITPTALPGPSVIGEAPSFPVTLGEVPTTPGAKSGFAVPDTALDGAELAGLTIRAASVRGDSHRRNGTLRQDSMGTWRIDEGALNAVLVCAADGVGSEPHSHRGAAAACQLLRDNLAKNGIRQFFDASPGKGLTDLWQERAEQLASTLSEMAGRQRLNPKALSTTLSAALIEERPTSPTECRYVVLTVGDATAFTLRSGQFKRLLADPHDGPFIDNSTWSLPTSVGSVGADTGTLARGDMLMVCTDGMSNPMRQADVRRQLADWWGGESTPGLLEFGWQLGYRVRSYDDDRTAVCIWSR
jgi:serine/threonine protein phosphatase PrpC